MMIELTNEQHLALAQLGAEPIRAIDPATRAEYVLVPAEAYERLKSLLCHDQEWSEGAHRAAMEVLARDGWADPRIDDYDPDEGMAHISEVMAEDDAHDPLLDSYQHYAKRQA